MTRKYVQVAFRPGQQAYTYHCDRDVQVGGEVQIENRSGQPMILEVLSVSDEAPPFPTKEAIPL